MTMIAAEDVSASRAHHGLMLFALLVLLCLLPQATAGVWSPLKKSSAPSLNLPLEPEVGIYTAQVAFDAMPAFSVTSIVSPPGETNRLFLLNQFGVVMVVTNLAQPNTTVFLDISSQVERGAEAGLLGLAFHPGYQTNGFFYLFYTTRITTPQGVGVHDRLSRFQVSPNNPNAALPNSELPLITQLDPDPLHNAGDLHFGPDGYLYISVGDGGGGLDLFNNSQRIDKNFFSGILRIDVDQRPGNLPPNPHPGSSPHYSIPRDNPFLAPPSPNTPPGSGVDRFNGFPVDPSRVRTEFYAVGLRNPWRFCFDPLTGDLYCNDTGQDSREEVNLIRKGGNYGWAFMEGSLPGPKFTKKPDAAQLSPPLAEYEHTQGRRAITGGIVYRGDLYPELSGAYLFADLEGDIGVVRQKSGAGSPIDWIAFSRGIATFGQNPATGEVLVSDGVLSRVRKLERNLKSLARPLPKKLSETGIFSDLQQRLPSPGVIPYDINVPFWSDHAIKRRWFALMDGSAQIEFNRSGNWSFPPGMVWIKHFDMERTKGVPSSATPLETRVVVQGLSGVHGFTYRWNNLGTDADLVPANGADETLSIVEGGVTKPQAWRYPARQECLACHTAEGGYALAFHTPQLNRSCPDPSTTQSQIQALSEAGFFTAPVSNFNTLRQLARADDESWSLEYRVRSYLAANCSQCHQPGQTGPGLWDGRISPPLPQTGLIRGPVKQSLEGGLSELIVPGHPEKSVLLYRISHHGTFRMPPLGSSVLDQKGIDLISRWITQLGQTPALYNDWALAHFSNPTGTLTNESSDPDGDGESNLFEFLTRQSPLAGTPGWRVSISHQNGAAQIHFPRTPDRLFRVEWTENLAAPNSWIALDSPSNQPFVAQSETLASVVDLSLGPKPRYYRVRIFQP